MKNHRRIAATAFLAVLAGIGIFFLLMKRTTPKGAFHPAAVAMVESCSDGDTCRIRLPGPIWMNVRLAGIDAPETRRGKRPGQPFANDAQIFLEQQVRSRQIHIRQTDLDQYNRPGVELTDGTGKSINKALIAAGLAEVWRGRGGRGDDPAWTDLEAVAQADQRGIWSLPTYVSPGAYRRRMRQNGAD